MGSLPQSSFYQNIFPKFFEFSGVKNLQYLPNGAPYIGNLSAREINFVFNRQNGAYEAFFRMPVQEQVRLVEQARKDNPKGNIDIGNYVMAPYVNAMRQSPFYQRVKAATSYQSRFTSRVLYQLSVNPTLHPALRLALKMRADVKRQILQRFKRNFQEIINKMGDDPETDRIRKEREEQDLKTLRAQLGLDDAEE